MRSIVCSVSLASSMNTLLEIDVGCRKAEGRQARGERQAAVAAVGSTFVRISCRCPPCRAERSADDMVYRHTCLSPTRIMAGSRRMSSSTAVPLFACKGQVAFYYPPAFGRADDFIPSEPAKGDAPGVVHYALELLHGFDETRRRLLVGDFLGQDAGRGTAC